MIRSVVLCLDNHKGITRPNTITFLSVLQSSLLKNGLFLCDNVEIITPIFCDFPDNDAGEHFVRSERFFVVKALLGRKWGYLSKTKSFWQFVTNHSKNNRHFQKLRPWQYSQSLGKLVNESCFDGLASFSPINLFSLYSQRIYIDGVIKIDRSISMFSFKGHY